MVELKKTGVRYVVTLQYLSVILLLECNKYALNQISVCNYKYNIQIHKVEIEYKISTNSFNTNAKHVQWFFWLSCLKSEKWYEQIISAQTLSLCIVKMQFSCESSKLRQGKDENHDLFKLSFSI